MRILLDRSADIEFVVPLSYSLAQSLSEANSVSAFDFKTELSIFKTWLSARPRIKLNMILGTEWVIDAVGCDPAILTDLGRMHAVFDRVISDLDLHVQGKVVWHQFSLPDGVSGLALLSESHLACHTYPEFRAATFNLYCCNKREPWPWETMLKEMLDARGVTVRVLDRLIQEEEPAREEMIGRPASN